MSELRKTGEIDWKKIGHLVANQFGLGGDAEDDPAAALPPLTPEELRQANIEIDAATRGRMVAVPSSPPVPSTAPSAALSAAARDVVDNDGTVDFSALYAQAQVEPAKFTAEQALDMVKDCEPTDAARKQTIKLITVFGKNVGATPDEIIVDAVSKQDALDAFVQERSSELVDFQAKIRESREQLQAQLAHMAEVETQAEAQYNKMRQSCLEEHNRLETVREFFRKEVPAPPGAKPTPSEEKDR